MKQSTAAHDQIYAFRRGVLWCASAYRLWLLFKKSHSRVGAQRAVPLLYRLIILIISCLPISTTPIFAQVPLPTTPATRDGFLRAPRLGITFINSTDAPIKADRYQQALFLGAGWNRWPLYWDRVEYAPAQFNWSAYDALVTGDVRNGLRTNAILMGRPTFWQSGSSIFALGLPIFSDGSDIPGPGKTIHPSNGWANFVFAAVQRYRPEGVLARQENWPPATGVRVWEAWKNRIFRCSGLPARRNMPDC
jgi:hypothetical protein